MKDIEREQEVIRQYLLGELDEERKDQLEQKVMTQRDFKQEVLIVEEELLDDYVSGALSVSEQELLLRNYLSSPNQSQKLIVARALGRYASIHKPSGPPQAETGRLRSFFSSFRLRGKLNQFSWAAAILLIVAGTAFIIWQLGTGAPDEMAQLNGPNSVVLEPGPSVVLVNLSGILLRAKGPRPVDVSSETKVVQLRIDTDNPESTHQAVLRDSAGKEIFRLNDLRARAVNSGSMIVIQIPIHRLPPGDYELELNQVVSGTAPAPRHYSFQVSKP